jgi:hypothetical protein
LLKLALIPAGSGRGKFKNILDRCLCDIFQSFLGEKSLVASEHHALLHQRDSLLVDQCEPLSSGCFSVSLPL